MVEEKNNKGFIALLVILVIILAVLCVLFATGTINLKVEEKCVDNDDTNQVEDIKAYSYNEIAGLYSYTESFVSQEGENLNEVFDLLLNEDGTYFYSDAIRISLRHTGNYIIEGDVLTINKLYSVSDGPTLSPSFETIKMTIEDSGQITYNAKLDYGNGEAKVISFTKQDETSKTNFINKFGADKEKLLKIAFYEK